ncbi:MAG: MoaD/ThiS family protein [Bacteroidota bacterium]
MDQKLTIRLFGPFTDVFPERSIMVDRVNTVGELEFVLKSLNVTFTRIPFRIAVNKRLSLHSDLIGPADEIAVLPPFSGG